MQIIIGLFILGLSFGSGPCLASCGPILVSYIAGTKNSPGKALGVYFIFSLARIAVYVVFSALVFFLGNLSLERFLGSFSRYLAIAGGIFILGVGILMLLSGKTELGFCRFLRARFLEDDRKSIVLMGLTMGIAPCAPLVAILSYIGLVAQSWPQSLYYGLSFGAGTLVSPLVLLAVFSGLLQRWVNGDRPVFARVFNAVCGLLVAVSGAHLIIKGVSAHA